MRLSWEGDGGGDCIWRVGEGMRLCWEGGGGGRLRLEGRVDETVKEGSSFIIVSHRASCMMILLIVII